MGNILLHGIRRKPFISFKQHYQILSLGMRGFT
jgi:hypothetical protein